MIGKCHTQTSAFEADRRSFAKSATRRDGTWSDSSDEDNEIPNLAEHRSLWLRSPRSGFDNRLPGINRWANAPQPLLPQGRRSILPEGTRLQAV